MPQMKGLKELKLPVRQRDENRRMRQARRVADRRRQPLPDPPSLISQALERSHHKNNLQSHVNQQTL
jgi:hypothetical protein